MSEQDKTFEAQKYSWENQLMKTFVDTEEPRMEFDMISHFDRQATLHFDEDPHGVLNNDNPTGSVQLLRTEEEIEAVAFYPSVLAPIPNGRPELSAFLSPFAEMTKSNSQSHHDKAQRVAEIKMMKKQARAEAAREARKQRVLIAAEERQKRKEQMKIFRQQEKMQRLEQLRMDKELRAQQLLEEKRQKKEAAAIAKKLEAEKRKQEKEQQRLEALVLKQQEKERVKQQMMLLKAAEAQRKAEEKERVKQQMMLLKAAEAQQKAEEKERVKQQMMLLKAAEAQQKAEEKERVKQQMMLLKAAEAQQKAEEKERLRKEKEHEKQLNKERKLELQRLEQEKLKELKKPKEDLCLADHQPLPELSRVAGLGLSGKTFSDCLMVLEFLHQFGKALDLGFTNSKQLTMEDLQEGLLNIGESVGLVLDLLVNMLSAALRDPGMPAAHQRKTVFGEEVTEVEIDRDNVSDVLQVYMEAHAEQQEAAVSLMSEDFQAHSPSEKASMLAFLVNQLCCSKAVISEINRNLDHMTNLKKDKRAVNGQIRNLKGIHANKRGKKDSGVPAEDNPTIAFTNSCKRKAEEYDEDDNQGDDREEEPAGKKARTSVEEDDGVQSASMEDVEEQLETQYKQRSHIKQKMLQSSRSLRSQPIGHDRYKRRYWVFSHYASVFVEGMESDEDSEETEEDHGSQHAEGLNQINTPAPPAGASLLDVDMVEMVDSSTPQPIPEEMLRGWWTVSETEDLQSLAQALHSRGIREKVLQKNIQQHMEDVALLSEDNQAASHLQTQC